MLTTTDGRFVRSKRRRLLLDSHRVQGVGGWLFGLVAILLTTLSTIPLMAQTSTGGITGRVEDSQHGMIVDAIVTITNVGNNQALVLHTDHSGNYTASALSPGTYVVGIAKPGFEDVQVTSVAVNIAAIATVNAVMKIGSAATTVTVNAQAQLLDETSPTFSVDVPNEISRGIPLPERSALEVVMLSPGVQGNPSDDMGVSTENPGIYTAPVAPGGSLSVGGGRPGSALQLVDGVDLSMVGYPRVGLTFSGDDLQQISVQSAGIVAKYGRTGGGVINQASKGGTLMYHGKLGFRHEDPFFEATTFGQGTINFASAKGTIVRPVTQNNHQNMFTGTFGGPVPIPFLNINKNTFFFASYEPLRAGGKAWGRIRVPTPAELSGDFSNAYTLLNASILSSQGYAAAVAAPRVAPLQYQFPLNAQGFPDGAHYNTPSQYVNIPKDNVSAQLALNPFAQFVLSQFPKPGPNGQGTPYVNFLNSDASYANDGNNALGARGVSNTDNRYNIRIDQSLGSSDRAFVRYTVVPVSGIRYASLGPNSPINNQPESIVKSQNALIDFSHVFHGSAVNDLRFSYTRMNYIVQPAPSTTTTDFAAKYGLTPSAMGVGFPAISIDTGGYGSSTGGNDGGLSVNASYSLGDDFSLVVGKHSLSFGGEWRAMQLDRLPNTGIFGGNYSFAAGNTSNGSAGGNATASFILGSINGLTLAPLQEFYYRVKYVGLYAMDSWKVSPRLTLDIGLRYNLEFPRTEKNGLQGSFLPSLGGSLNGAGATGGFAFSGTHGLPTTIYPVNYKGFEPRFGFAYAVNQSLVVRGSANLIHAPMTGITNSNIPALTPNSLTLGGAVGGQNSANWVNYMTNPVALPSTGIPGILKGPSPYFSYGSGFLPYVSQSDAVPYTENWSLSVQYQVSKSTVVQAAYVGNQSHHLFSPPTEINILPMSTVYSEIQSGYNFTANTVPSTYFPTVKVNPNSNILPFPQFYNNNIDTAFVRENAASYTALYLNGVQQMHAGLTLIGSFTWSKSMDDGSSGSLDGITTDSFGFSYPQTPFSRAGEWSLSTYDIPTHLTGAYSWNLPIGRGQLLNTGDSRLLNAIFGGLHNSGMFNAESGYPAWPTLGNDGYFFSTLPVCSSSVTTNCTSTLRYGSGGNALSYAGHGLGTFNVRPNLVPGVPLIKANWKQDPYNLTGHGGYLNPAAFAVPGSPGNPQFGNSPRTLGGARSPHTIYFDMSASKDIPIHERAMLTVRADAMNVLNHTNYFLNPNSAHNFTSSLNFATGAYLVNPLFGTMNNGQMTPGRTFGVGAALVF